jgi:tetratricopeptide (TPR) repeat protein
VLLGTLARTHLIQPAAGDDRHQMHDLLRAYAASQATDRDSRQARRAALTRLFDYYLATCAAALDCLAPAEKQHRPAPPPSGPAGPELTDQAAALAWLEAELATLTAVVTYTAAHGWASHTTRLATTLLSYLAENHPLRALTIHTHALDAARASGDRAAQAHALVDLGSTHFHRGDYQQALDCYGQALSLAHELDDRFMLARALGSLATVHCALAATTRRSRVTSRPSRYGTA